MVSTRKLAAKGDDEKAEDPAVGSTTSGSRSTQTVKSQRGPTHMHALAIQRVQGYKKKVTFNAKGQPYGPYSIEMQSYIGVLAREKVNITIDNWKDVSSTVKESIWEAVNVRKQIIFVRSYFLLSFE